MCKRDKQYLRLVVKDIAIVFFYLSVVMICNELVISLIPIDTVFNLRIVGIIITLLNLATGLTVFRYFDIVFVDTIKELKKLKSSNNERI